VAGQPAPRPARNAGGLIMLIVRKPAPPLETVGRTLESKLGSLERRLRAPEGTMEALPPRAKPEKQALALAKGLKKLRRAAVLARAACAPVSCALAAELTYIATCIESQGMVAQIATALQAMVGAAVAVEAETGEPVARRLSEAVGRFEGLFRWSEGSRRSSARGGCCGSSEMCRGVHRARRRPEHSGPAGGPPGYVCDVRR
jgi:hypothetical protein